MTTYLEKTFTPRGFATVWYRAKVKRELLVILRDASCNRPSSPTVADDDGNVYAVLLGLYL
jgi:hypothetical protein